MKNRLIILHCFGGSNSQNWYQPVGNELADFFDVAIPNLPNPDKGDVGEWLSTLEELKPDEHTILIGHSLGGTLILRYLEQAQRPIHSFFLVAAPINDLARNDLHSTGFFERDFNWPIIQANSTSRFVIASKDDHVVPYWQAEFLVAQLGAKLISFDDKSHFKQDNFNLAAIVQEELDV